MSDKKKLSLSPTCLVFGLLIAAVLFGVAAHYLGGTYRTAEREPAAVFGGWTYGESDRQRAGGVLAKAGLTDYRWEDGRLLVPEAKRSQYEQVLGENQALPLAPSDVKRQALTEMTQFEPESKTRMRDLYSSGWQLEQTLGRFRQIESATVGVWTRTEQSGLTRRNVTTATVGVWTKKEYPQLSPELISAVTLAVRHQLGITENKNISIMDLRNGCSYWGSDMAVGSGDRLSYSEEQLRQENLWREKFSRAFENVPNIRVVPTVDLIPMDESAETVSNTSPSEPAVSEATLGNVPNGSGGLVFQSSSYPSNEKAADEAPAEVRRFKPGRVALLISVPQSYVDRESKEVLTTLRQTAETLLGVGEAERSEPRSVEVTVYDDAPAVEEQGRPKATFSKTLRSVVEPIVVLYKRHPKECLLGLAAVGFVLCLVPLAARRRRGTAKRAAASSEAHPAYSTLSEEDRQLDQSLAEAIRKLHESESEIKAEVAGRIEDDPRRAADILRDWMKAGA